MSEDKKTQSVEEALEEVKNSVAELRRDFITETVKMVKAHNQVHKKLEKEVEALRQVLKEARIL